MADPNTYTVGWICALEIELVAAASFLDEEHEDPDYVPVNDNNSYVLGRIGRHNVVIAALPNGQYGLVSAAAVARDMVHSFPNVRTGLMVGIGGGAPSPKHDIRLGDVVVSSPSSGYDSGGVFQYDYGRTIQDSDFVVTGHLNQPPQFMLAAMSTLRAQYRRRGHAIEETITDKLTSNPRLQVDFRKPHYTTDRLYNSAYKHVGAKEEDCTVLCKASQLTRTPRQVESRDHPTIHYGIIASANQLMRDAKLRDKLSAENHILCFEMEAAGLMNQFPCVVIRGICDYSDTHKNKIWQGYAAMAAAAYAKDLLQKILPNKLEAERNLVDLLSNVRDEVHAISITVDDTQLNLRATREKQHLKDVSEWLSAPDVSSNFNRAKETRHPGSGQRLIVDEAYKEWKRRPNSFLWFYGIPGCGKTILTSTVIDDLRISLDQPQTTLYFYFDFTDTRKQAFENCMRSLLDQLCYTSELARKEVDTLYETCKDGKEQPSKGSLQETLATILRTDEIWLVLDALDECKVRDDLLLWLRSLRDEDMKLHVIATSRLAQDIEQTMKQICSNKEEKMAIDEKLLEADIRNYVHAIIREHDDFQIWKSLPNVQEEIVGSLIGKAHGMFRWVWCQLGALKKCRDPIALRKALASLPNDLDETYARILANIPLEYIDHTLRILQFLTYSKRPLRIEEVVDAIAVKAKPETGIAPRFDIQDRMPNPVDIVGYCSSLAIIVERKSANSTIRELQLAHFSVKDYLTSDRLESRISLYLQEMSAQSAIAEVCLAYISELQQNPIEDIRNTFHFADYSVEYWASHAALVESHDQTIFDLAKELFLDQSRMRIWYLLRYNYESERNMNTSENVVPSLIYASLFGLTRCCRMLLGEGVDVNAHGGAHGTALGAASFEGHEEIVRMLLENGADVNGDNTSYAPLLLALDQNHIEIATMLLEKGADIEAHDGYALQAALSRGHRQIVNFLLKNGADVDAQDGHALQAASYRGSTEIVKVLLDRGANVNPPFASESPLHLAVEGADEDLECDNRKAVVQMLLQHGAQVDVANDSGYTPLAMAAERGFDRIIKILLAYEANVNGFADPDKIPLLLATRYGHLQTMILLIKRGAVINGFLGAHHLWVAAASGHWEILDLLLAAGAEPRLEDSLGRSALTCAIIHGQSVTVEILLAEPDLDINARDRWGSTAVSFAARSGSLAVFQKLVAVNNVDLYAEDDFGRTSLWWARKRGRDDIANHIINNLQRPPNAITIQSQKQVSPARPRTPKSGFDLRKFCAVCLLSLDFDGPMYRCIECERGELTICQGCFEVGAHCLVESHTLECEGELSDLEPNSSDSFSSSESDSSSSESDSSSSPEP